MCNILIIGKNPSLLVNYLQKHDKFVDTRKWKIHVIDGPISPPRLQSLYDRSSVILVHDEKFIVADEYKPTINVVLRSFQGREWYTDQDGFDIRHIINKIALIEKPSSSFLHVVLLFLSISFLLTLGRIMLGV